MPWAVVLELPDQVAAHLAAGGLFARKLEGFTPRESQQEMAAAVADTLQQGGTLVAESGTGTGKTFAYLAPILLSGKRTIVSTGTRHLQDQIYHRDLPEVARVLDRPVKTMMLKGRSNYLCRHRLKQNATQTDLAGNGQSLPFNIIQRWATTTDSGDIAEVTQISDQSSVWKEVTSTTDNCLGGKCPEYQKCHVVRARKKAMEADVVVVNHHLFFSDLTLKDDGFGELLPAYDAVVFDEAHALSEIASGFFGFAVSGFQVGELCSDIALAEKTDQSGANLNPGLAALQQAEAGMHKALAKYVDQSVNIHSVDSAAFRTALEQLQICLDNVLVQLETAAAAGEDLERCYQRGMQMQGRLDSWIEGRDHNLVRWLSVTRRSFRLQATPLMVSDRFRELMHRASSWIFTSATLAMADDFSAFSNRLGIEHGRHLRWQSPYNFAGNSLVLLPTDMPDPRERGYAERMADLILEITSASKGRAFCLFTSYAMMNRVHGLVKGRLKWPLLLQGTSPRSELMDQFQNSPNSVLFGTSSFWEGVDVKGDALSCVIIDKLPFAPPGDPVLKSRLQACEEQGGNPFMEIQVPGAAMALKQGAGRLIRSETDRGVLVLCDPRILGKRYGKLFLDSLPPMPVTRQVHDVEKFFEH